MAKAWIIDGEAFAIITQRSPPSMHTPVQLDIRLQEADHFDNGQRRATSRMTPELRIGIDGEPTAYAYMIDHPGAAQAHSATSFSAE